MTDDKFFLSGFSLVKISGNPEEKEEAEKVRLRLLHGVIDYSRKRHSIEQWWDGYPCVPERVRNELLKLDRNVSTVLEILCHRTSAKWWLKVGKYLTGEDIVEHPNRIAWRKKAPDRAVRRKAERYDY